MSFRACPAFTHGSQVSAEDGTTRLIAVSPFLLVQAIANGMVNGSGVSLDVDFVQQTCHEKVCALDFGFVDPTGGFSYVGFEMLEDAAEGETTVSLDVMLLGMRAMFSQLLLEYDDVRYGEAHDYKSHCICLGTCNPPLLRYILICWLSQRIEEPHSHASFVLLCNTYGSLCSKQMQFLLVRSISTK